MCLDRLFFFQRSSCHNDCTVHANREEGKRQVIWCLRRPHKFMILGLCISLKCGCLTSSWWKEPWSRSCRWRRQVAKWTKGNLTKIPSSTTRLSSTIPYLLFSISYSSSSSSFFLSTSCSCSFSLRSLQALPPLLQGPVVQVPPGAKILTGFKFATNYKIVTGITRLWFSCLCNPDRTWRTKIQFKKKMKKN